MNPTTVLCALLLASFVASPASAQPANSSPAKVRIAIAGLAHGHLGRIVRLIKASPDVELVGLFDADPALHALMAERYALPRPLFHGNLDAMLDATKPRGRRGVQHHLRSPGGRGGRRPGAAST